MTEAAATRWWSTLHGRIALAFGLALVVGVALGALGIDSADEPVLQVADFVGDLFLRLLKMAIVPLVFATVASGVASINPTRLGSLGTRTLVYFVGTTGLAVTLGLVLVNAIKPGAGVEIVGCSSDADCAPNYVCSDGGCLPTVAPPVLRDVFLKVVPENPFASMAATFDLLGVICFALLLGVAMASVGEAARPLRAAIESLGVVVDRIVAWVMAVAPIGIFALLVQLFATTGLGTLKSLALYMFTVVLGLGLHGFVLLPLLLWMQGIAPARFIGAMSPALWTAFSTASSSATLPVTISSATERAGIDRETAAFVIPLGATVNMNGTALYEAIAALFIAQAFGIELTLAAQVIVFITATLAAIGAPGIPSAGLVTMVMVLEAAGLPVEGIALLLAVDRILDMCRTTMNVWGDAVGAAILAKRDGRYTGPVTR